MELSLEEKYEKITQEILKQTGKDPVAIVKTLMHQDFVSMHGPEHHFLDGAAFLTAYHNAGGALDLETALEKLKERSRKMPGAMCGQWGICGSVASLGAALSILHDVGPLSSTGYYGDDMEYTAAVLMQMAKLGGPRCCKRNAFLSLRQAVNFVKEKYRVEMEQGNVTCEFSLNNAQCLKERCPFHRQNGR